MHKLFLLEMGLPPAYPEKEMTSMNAPEPYRVLFVCLGNICRSPAAEIIFKKMVAEQGLEHLVESDSAGMIGYHGAVPRIAGC